MSVDIKYSVKPSWDKVAKAYGEAEKVLRPYIKQGVLKYALMIEEKAKKRTPVDTGRLRASIGTSIDVGNRIDAVVQTNTNYALYVHEGHRQQVGRYVPAIGKRLVKPYVEGKPFMKEGFEEAKRHEDAILQEVIDDALAKITSL